MNDIFKKEEFISKMKINASVVDDIDLEVEEIKKGLSNHFEFLDNIITGDIKYTGVHVNYIYNVRRKKDGHKMSVAIFFSKLVKEGFDLTMYGFDGDREDEDDIIYYTEDFVKMIKNEV